MKHLGRMVIYQPKMGHFEFRNTLNTSKISSISIELFIYRFRLHHNTQKWPPTARCVPGNL